VQYLLADESNFKLMCNSKACTLIFCNCLWIFEEHCNKFWCSKAWIFYPLLFRTILYNLLDRLNILCAFCIF